MVRWLAVGWRAGLAVGCHIRAVQASGPSTLPVATPVPARCLSRPGVGVSVALSKMGTKVHAINVGFEPADKFYEQMEV